MSTPSTPRTVTLSARSEHREIAVDALPRNVRAAVEDLSARNPGARVLIDQSGALYRIHLSEPANLYRDVLAVA